MGRGRSKRRREGGKGRRTVCRVRRKATEVDPKIEGENVC